ncbi:ZZ-type zinc finger-containing protein 3 isoform X2 [Stegastes partitus]|nr:PREDICTED: ZZ-type zinc finger-containing protein 3 isoform X2 [Stegastes partitus]XP_008277862.1 PREDICTED: ZZ-type zinc finger-containing protein 3 isoform X2 [Stegastes partitus]XP_008277863.1 PREDICTED: ZZ-type zinc finger-containing protein 3 isoform X2 [Stegastes partitus]XP_008277864.1 PREDICTED: ZZ-type zinc finger-containing protein 3 isoform X2 [Stegastes partitus]XP_008277865.1 PREDICTED: ZZ-type zinc finger-containing protein 3 isoform X2 [Stegastes partitus]
MAASRSSRVTRSSVGLNGLDENFCGRTLRNRSIAQPEETSVSPLPRARSPKKKQDAKQESKQDAKQESKQDAKQESKQDAKQDAKQQSKQDAKQESKQDTKQDKKQDPKQESKQDTKQDTKQDSNQDVKQESKQEAKEDTNKDEKQVTHSQDGQQQASLPGKVTDSNASPAEADQWTSSRKRGVSCLGKDISPEKSENCDGGKGARGASPQIKRAKRCSRSGESQGQEEEDPEPPKPESPVSVPEPRKDTCEELPSQNSADTAPASPILSKQEGELTGGKAEDGHVECDGVTQPQNAHKASNGLRENKAEESCTLTEEPSADPTSATNFPLLLNGSQTGTPSSPDPAVPCRNSVPVQMEASGSGESPASSAPTFEGALEDSVPELMVAKEQEVEEMEVDVVGDPLCLAHEEQVTETQSDTNGRPLTPVQEAAPSTSSSTTNMNSSPINNNSNSGETTPPLTTSPSPTEPGCNPSISSTSPSFTELYEHRYTLRTSPRRAVSGSKASSSKPGSPPRDNGPLREEGEVVVGLEEDCPTVKGPAPSDSIGPSSEEPASVSPGDRAVGEDGGPMEGKEAESSKELTRSQAAEEEEEEEEEEEPDVYYFESDHLALKHNKDYQRLLQTIGVLEAQRTQAILDLETLARHQREALADPISFVEQLQKRVNLGLPCPQRVVQLPDIAWEQYTSGLGDFEREFCDKKRKTRRLKLIFDKGLPLRPKSPVEPKKEGESSTMYSSLPMSDAPENGGQTQMIRGRICHPNKPDTFNQLWTVEEQKKLEQLLVKFPPEEVESRRWQKIADELGNRTAKQVASRVQKYFIKLTKAGIPVPGRTPNLCMYTKKASSKRQHHLNKHLYRPSTFLTSYEPPVYMDEDDERAAYYNSVQDPSADDSDDESVPVELRNLPEYKELLELKRLKKQKLQEIQEDKAGVQHVGYKCDVCGMEPIQGVRWHCQDCPQDNSVDFCSNCSDCLFKTETHKPNHHLEPVYQPDTFLDRDYCLPQSTGYNYLDPNYFPANR